MEGELYRILIVDDEPDMREGIVQCVPWNDLGYQVVAQAENGQDALDKMENAKVDVILTDIKMPFMDGLTMAQRVSLLYPGVKIIILSGFDEFEYAKTAISLNVAEYVLKPINASELGTVLARVKEKLDEELTQQRSIDRLTESYEQMRPLIFERFLIELLWGTVSHEEAMARLAEYDTPLNDGGHYIVAVFQAEDSQRGGIIGNELVPFSVADMVKGQVAGRCAYHVLQVSAMVVLISVWKDPSSFDQMISIAEEICARSARVLEVTLNAGIGRSYPQVISLHKSFAEARRAMEYKEIIGTGKAIYIGDMEQRNVGTRQHFDNRGEEYFIRLLKFGTTEQIEQFVVGIGERLADANALERRAYMTGLFHALYSVSQYHDIQSSGEVSEKLQWFIHSSPQWEDLAVMSGWLREVCLLVRSVISENRKSSSRVLVDSAVRYLEEHYGESSLSVEQMCEKLHLSQSYFSTIFKQEMGQSFVRYLTELRMNRALELLEHTEEKTYEIAEKVGYDEPNYFSYVFKKQFGISPTKYRAKRKESNE